MVKDIGKKIKKFRQESGYSQLKLAELCGWDSQSRISNYEAGLREPSLSDLETIAKALDKDYTELLADNNTIKSSAAFELPLYTWNQIKIINESKPIKTIKKIAPRNVFALVVEDDSMSTTDRGRLTFVPGSIIIVEPTKEAIIDKYFIIKHLETGAILFRQLKNLGTSKRFMPINPIADNCLLEEAEILGMVVANVSLNL